LHSVTVWASEYGLSLGQVACAEKSNEITAIPELLKLVDVSGGVVTIDAMGCQKEIAGAVVAAEGDYVLALKGNQGTLHQAAIDHLMSRWEADFAGDEVGRLQVVETAHGRRETRTYIQLEAPKNLPGFKSWRGLKSIGVTISEVVRDGETTDEVRYYISSLAVEPDAKTLAHAIRSHWGIENGCHWTLDVTFREDESRIREKLARENMAWLNRFALSLLKQVPDRKSVAMRRRCCAWSDDYLMQVLAASTS
jgi:predicted transposase YbfD/YdcC